MKVRKLIEKPNECDADASVWTINTCACGTKFGGGTSHWCCSPAETGAATPDWP